MRRTLLFFILFPASIFAQEWSPVNLTDKYNYRLDNDPVITQTTWQTNYSVNGPDTTFFFNKTFCENCVTIVNGPAPCDTCYAQRNLPRFFGSSVLKTAAGICSFRTPGSRVIETFAQLNDTWLFDTLNTISAQIIFSGIGNVLGNTDSVKTILLSTNDTVQFSKNYGITTWPNGYGQNSYYRLAGIQGRNIGVLVPRTMDYFGFNVGDMFEYQSHYQGCSASTFIHFATRKYTITSATTNGDTTIYRANGYISDYYTNYNMQNPISGTNYDTLDYAIIVVDSAGHLGNLFNGEMVESEGRAMIASCGDYGGVTLYPGGIMVAGTRLFVDSTGTEAIEIAGPNVDDLSLTDFEAGPTDIYQQIPQATDTLAPFSALSSTLNRVILKKGLGQVAGLYEEFEGYYAEHLTAYRKGNDTVGVFTPDGVLNGIQHEEAGKMIVNVFPNPSAGVITVQLPANANAVIDIIDLQGRIVKTFTGQGGQVTVQAGGLSDGIYLLEIRSALGSSQQKIVISH